MLMDILEKVFNGFLFGIGLIIAVFIMKLIFKIGLM